MLTKRDIVEQILRNKNGAPLESASAFASANIALCKYWGKRDEELNLPVTSSLSVSLGSLGSRATLQLSAEDVIELNGETLSPDSSFAKRAVAFLDLFRFDNDLSFRLIAENTIPTDAGFASSASGFAALTLALDRMFGWELDRKHLSILARLGSGSACRSMFNGFVEWHAGSRPDGLDSYAERIDAAWPELKIGLLVITEAQKGIGSRAAMKHTVETSPLYSAWPETVAGDLLDLKHAIRERDFNLLGRTAESNALTMHATMLAAWPSVIYWLPESLSTIHRVRALREQGLNVYFTMDAGPNIKLLFEDKYEADVREAFPELLIPSDA